LRLLNTIILLPPTSVSASRWAQENDAERKNIILEVVRASLRPELYNRIGQVIAFNPLSEHELERIVGVQLAALGKETRGRSRYPSDRQRRCVALLPSALTIPNTARAPLDASSNSLCSLRLPARCCAQDVYPGQSVLLDVDADGLTFNVMQSDAAPDTPEVCNPMSAAIRLKDFLLFAITIAILPAATFPVYAQNKLSAAEARTGG